MDAASPVATSQTMTSWSRPAVTSSRPSGLKATRVDDVLVARERRCSPSAVRKRTSSPSARRDCASRRRGPLRAGRGRAVGRSAARTSSMPVPGSQTRIVPSAPPVTTSPVRGELAAATAPSMTDQLAAPAPRRRSTSAPCRRRSPSRARRLAPNATSLDVAPCARRAARGSPVPHATPAPSGRCSPSRSARPSGRTRPRAPARYARAAGAELSRHVRVLPDAPVRSTPRSTRRAARPGRTRRP